MSNVPEELSDIIEMGDYRVNARGCWLTNNLTDMMVEDPITDQWEDIREAIYYRISGEELSDDEILITRCGQYDSRGFWQSIFGGELAVDCINPDHFSVINKHDNSSINKIRHRKNETKEITQDQIRTIVELSQRYHWTRIERGRIFALSLKNRLQIYDTSIDQARAKAEQGDYAGAITDCNQAIVLEPESADAYLLRARAKAEQGDYAGAIADCSQADENCDDPPDSTVTAFYVLQVLVKTDLGDYDGALEDFHDSIFFDDDFKDDRHFDPVHIRAYVAQNLSAYISSRFYFLGGLVYIATDNLIDAIAKLDEAVNLDPDYARVYWVRACVKAAQGDYNGATTDRNQAVRLNSDIKTEPEDIISTLDRTWVSASRNVSVHHILSVIKEVTVEIETAPEETEEIPEPEPLSVPVPISTPQITERPRIRVSTREYEQEAETPEVIELDYPPEPDKPLMPKPETRPEPEIPSEPETPPEPEPQPPARKSKTTAALLAFLLGGFGAHKFYLGYTGPGIVHLLLSATVVGALVNVPICIVEFLIYVSKSDEEFHQTYVVNRRRFF